MKRSVRVIAVLVVLILVNLFIREFIVRKTCVSGTSMEPTLLEGEQILIDELTYRFRKPKRNEIVVFPYLYKENIYYIKRIIGLPGEHVLISEGHIYINGELLDDCAGDEKILDGGLATVEVILGEDEYFVLGDQRNVSDDSRHPDVGNIREADIIGKALFSLSSFTLIR